MKMKRFTLALAALMPLAPLFLAGQDTPSCSDDKSHQFDFWIGEWEVESGGELAGTNSIRPIVDGCVLQENWRGARGSAGTSLNFYNPHKEKWQQFWVWRNGTTLELEGSFSDGKMVLSGESVNREGKTVRNRITWYDNSDGTVRQHWEYSADGGSSWQTAFDGIYRKKKEKGP
jgi:hypothetical protein